VTTNEGVFREGSGSPVTIFASGGPGLGNLSAARLLGARVKGTRAYFEYSRVEPWTPGRVPRREAERDAAEARAVADRFRATQAAGSSRGARALLGVLAEDPARFERVVLDLPPSGTAAGRYREWLKTLPPDPTTPPTEADILILAWRGDSGHAAAVAEEWATCLGATLKQFPSMHRSPDVLEDMRAACQDFLNGS
jgi:hypothetical protein